MPSARQSSTKPAATIVNATAKTRSVIESLQARLAGESVGSVEPASVVPQGAASADESMDDLERELQAYFEQSAPSTWSGTASAGPSRTQILDELRSRVIDGVVDRIIAEWSRSQQGMPQSSGLGREVMDRLIDRVLQELGKTVNQ